MTEKRLPSPHGGYLELYLDCRARTRKKVPFISPGENGDAEFVRWALSNASLTENDPDTGRSFRSTTKFVLGTCALLCPGKWCDRFHCPHNNSSRAWNCDTTRPAVCKAYKEFARRRDERKTNGNEPEETARGNR